MLGNKKRLRKENKLQKILKEQITLKLLGFITLCKASSVAQGLMFKLFFKTSRIFYKLSLSVNRKTAFKFQVVKSLFTNLVLISSSCK